MGASAMSASGAPPGVGPVVQPGGWTPEDLRRDTGWAHRLDAAEIAAFERGLVHARASGKGFWDLAPGDFPFGEAALERLARALAETQQGRGFQMLRGLPVDRWSVEDARLFFWGLGLHLGVPRPQGRASQYMSDVRDAGGTYRSVQGRGYNTKSAFDFHADGSDLVGLMCLRTGVSGGESLIASSITAHNTMLAERPDLLARLYEPVPFSRQGEHAPEEPAWYMAAIIGVRDGRFACRHIRNHVMLHSRTDYVDHDAPERKRHLLRLWLSLPGAPALPESWRLAYKDVEACAVRGGFRGLGITPQIESFEARMAAHHAMAFRIYADRAHTQGVRA
ncbi:MAG: TauD/TfdA family dioxygenase [Burkholderiales bacterium]|nr:TauD/TfdA family dioxygenase [Burkholderiales bacterium]